MSSAPKWLPLVVCSLSIPMRDYELDLGVIGKQFVPVIHPHEGL